MGKNTYLKKGHKLDIKYLEIPEIFPQNLTIFGDILARNLTSNFGATLEEIGAKRDVSRLTCLGYLGPFSVSTNKRRGR